MKKIDIYFFSGTGNTFLVVNAMKEVFKEKGRIVNLFPIEKFDASKINTDNTIGLAFPVAVQATYPFVWDFIKKMPKANNTAVFMVDTLAAFSGGIVGPVRSILRKKGYLTIGAKEIIMPSNFLVKKIDNDAIDKKIAKGISTARKYANDILENRSTWGRIWLISYLMSLISLSKRPWKFFRRFYSFKIDKSKCSKCQLCVNLCPVGNIKMEEFPEFQDSCIFCQRCVSFCPTQSIRFPKKDYERYKSVKANELLKY